MFLSFRFYPKKKKDQIFALCQTQSKNKLDRLPTLAAFNSLTTETLPSIRCETLPVVPNPLKIVPGINVQT